MNVKKGDKVRVEYTGTFDDGEEFDSTERHGQPLEIESGAGMLIKGFDDALIGMGKGEEKEIKLKPEEAYGRHNPDLVKPFPKENLPPGKEFKEGMMLLLGTPDGKRMPAKVAEVTDKEIKIDLNHPLVDKSLNFKIKVVGINEPEEKKDDKPGKEGKGNACGCGCGH